MDITDKQTNGNPWYYLPKRAFSSMTPEEYIEERITQFRGWYDAKAKTTKKWYLSMRSCTVIGGAIVPVLINIHTPYDEYVKILTSLISLSVVILVSLESVYHYREQWKNYRSTEQLLAKEYFNFSTGEGHYRGLEPNTAFLDLVERVENAIESENASTLNVMTTLTENKVNSSSNRTSNI